MAASKQGLKAIVSAASALAAICCMNCLAAGEAGGPHSRFLKAYETLAAADVFFDAGLMEDAAALYTVALAEYVALGKDYPAWEPALIAFRRGYCETRMRAAGAPAQLDKPGADTAPVAAIPPPAAAAWAPEPLPGMAARPRRAAIPAAAGIETALEMEKAGKLDDALAIYREAIRKNPGNMEAVRGAGRCLMEMGDMDAAKEILARGIDPDAPDNDLLFMLAVIHCDTRHYDRAEYTLATLLELEPDNARARLLRGIALAGLGENGAAEHEFREAVRLNPKLGNAHYNLARLMARKNPPDIEAAREFYRLAVENGAEPDKAFEKAIFTHIED